MAPSKIIYEQRSSARTGRNAPKKLLRGIGERLIISKPRL